VSLSGEFQVQGRQALAGLQTWADDVNRSGGLTVDPRGRRLPVVMVYYDDASKSDSARQATDRLITRDKVDLLFGPYSSVLSRAAAEVAEAHQRLLWNQGGASDNIYQQGFRWLVGVLTPASGYLAGLLPLVRQADPGATTIGLIRAYPGAFPWAVSSAVHQQARSLGFQATYIREYPPTLKDFSNVLEEVKGIAPEVLVVVGRVSNDLQFARQLVKRPLGLKAVAVVAAPIHQFQEALGEGVEGFIGPSQWEPVSNDAPDYGPSAREVLESFQRRGHSPVDYPMAQAYAAGVVAQMCVERAGTLENQMLRETASKLDFSTFYGRFKVEPDTGRPVGRSTLMVQWQRGRKLVIWPPELSQAPLVYPWPGLT
jgi:branched-chain amino acid transport system substrate-binding protein